MSFRRVSKAHRCAARVPHAVGRSFAFRQRRYLALVLLLLVAVFLTLASPSASGLSGCVYVDNDLDADITDRLADHSDSAASMIATASELSHCDSFDPVACAYSIQPLYFRDDSLNVEIGMDRLIEEEINNRLANKVSEVTKYPLSF